MKNVRTDDIWARSCLIWAADNKINTEKGQPLEFANHRFLADIYDDLSPIQVAQKASQVGFSTLQIIKSFWMMYYWGRNIIYTLPTFGDVGQFVPSKVNPIIQNNPILAAWTKDKDTILQKKVGKSFIYYRGTVSGKSEKDKSEGGVGIMFTSDLNVMDECDRSDQHTLEQYESRLGASDYAGQWFFSNPTSPHTLSQKLYEKSDQKHWFVKCSHCNHRQYLDFWKNIQNDQFVCSKCGGIITDKDRELGQWVRKYSNREISGYWISHLICPWMSAKEIADNERTKTKAFFYNFVLGLPYRGSDIFVDRDMILRCIDQTQNFKERCVMGVDQGLKKHYVLASRQGIFKVGVADKWEEIEFLMKKYDVEVAVFDALPDLTEPRKLRDKYPGRVWLNYFKKEIKKADFIQWDDQTRTVYSDRTKIIQQVIDNFADRKIRFTMDVEELGEYIKHWQALYKTTETDNLGLERDCWEASGADHFCFATIYAMIAQERVGAGDTQIKKWSKDEVINYDVAPIVDKIAGQSTI